MITSAVRWIRQRLRASAPARVYSVDLRMTVTYLRCGGCDRVTPHQIAPAALVIGRHPMATGPEAVCDGCRTVQRRRVDDEVSVDGQMRCQGLRLDRRHGRGRHDCGRVFAVPRAAALALCPACGTLQPGPDVLGSRDHAS